MGKDEDQLRKSEDQSMRKSRVGNRYFKVDSGYDKGVYENTTGNWFKLIGAFILFYATLTMFFWATYSHCIRDVLSATWIYIGAFLINVAVIAVFVIMGHFSNKNMEKADRIMLDVNEEKKKKREEEERLEKREEAKRDQKKLEQQELASEDSEDRKPSKKNDKKNKDKKGSQLSDSEDNESRDPDEDETPGSDEDS